MTVFLKLIHISLFINLSVGLCFGCDLVLKEGIQGSSGKIIHLFYSICWVLSQGESLGNSLKFVCGKSTGEHSQDLHLWGSEGSEDWKEGEVEPGCSFSRGVSQSYDELWNQMALQSCPVRRPGTGSLQSRINQRRGAALGGVVVSSQEPVLLEGGGEQSKLSLRGSPSWGIWTVRHSIYYHCPPSVQL